MHRLFLRTSARRAVRLAAIVAAATVASAAVAFDARAENPVPPWTEIEDVPLPTWARSAVAKREEVPILSGPGRTEPRRGTPLMGTLLPIFGQKRGPGCGGRYILVGPYAWVCSDTVDLSQDDPYGPAGPAAASADPSAMRYYFAGKDGAYAYLSAEDAAASSPEKELEPGFALGIVGEKTVDGERWGRTRTGLWIAMRELGAARPSTFKGRTVTDGSMAFGWVKAESTAVYSAATGARKRIGTRTRHENVGWHDVVKGAQGPMVRISDDGAASEEWVLAKDVVRPTASDPPEEVDHADDGERWIDVDRATQTLVAYEGRKPVFATLVSTGRGSEGSETITPKGVHRIWVKLTSTSMDNLERDDAERHYSIEDVPWVQFFDKGVALHGAFWHRDFGRVRSHGCVNLSVPDAEWLFHFTGPHLPRGWSASLPTPVERGTAIRVR
ncbi:MAG: L,D-transpeptidase [Polyangiaceae bacterium]